MSWIHVQDKQSLSLFIAFGLVLILIILYYFLPDPLLQNPSRRFLPSDLPHSLGTDQLGRSLASRLYFGLMHSVELISLTMFTTLIIAIPTGLIAARYQKAEIAIDIIAGAIWSIPTFIIGLIVFIGIKGELIELKFALLGIFNWVPIFRSVRDITKQVQKSYYVTFALSMGMSDQKVYLLQILPNVLPAVFPIILLNLISLFEAEFVLSFLGLSYPDPTPTLGGMLRQGISYLNFNMILFPSVLLALIALVVVSLYQRIGINRK